MPDLPAIARPPGIARPQPTWAGDQARRAGQNPSTSLGFRLVSGSLQVAASPCWPPARRAYASERSWPFPTLFLQSLRRRLEPYPAMSPWCSCSFFPRRQRPHVRRQTFGTPNILPIMQLQPGIYSRGCSHSLMFRLPRSLDSQVAPTAEALSLQGGRAVYTTHSSGSYLPRDVVSLRIRHKQLIWLDFHQLDCSVVGCSEALK